jgi:hypothetical protein
MDTVRIGNTTYQAQVKLVHAAPDWPGADTLGDIGGYIDVGSGRVAWVLSRDGKCWVPIQGHESILQAFLEQER